VAGANRSTTGFVTIDRIETRRGGRLAVVLGDGRTVTAPAEAVERSGIAEGMAAAEQVIAELEANTNPAHVHQAALKLLRYRARNERQLRAKLVAKGYAAETVDAELARLREVGLVDDRAFAAAFVEERARRSPKGKRLVQMELAAKGIDRGVAAESVATMDDEALATQLAAKRLRSASPGTYNDYVARIGPYLTRRGFGFEAARNAMRRAWEERDNTSVEG
jgi:regulatory protein